MRTSSWLECARISAKNAYTHEEIWRHSAKHMEDYFKYKQSRALKCLCNICLIQSALTYKVFYHWMYRRNHMENCCPVFNQQDLQLILSRKASEEDRKFQTLMSTIKRLLPWHIRQRLDVLTLEFVQPSWYPIQSAELPICKLWKVAWIWNWTSSDNGIFDKCKKGIAGKQ